MSKHPPSIATAKDLGGGESAFPHSADLRSAVKLFAVLRLQSSNQNLPIADVIVVQIG